MQIEDPLIGRDIEKDFEMEIWIDNKKTKLIKNDATIQIGSHKIDIENAIGLITPKKK